MPSGNHYFVKTPNDLISIISLWSQRGSSLDPKGKEGLTHYFEHLFLNHAKSLPDKIAVLRKIDGLGLFFNANTRKNFVYYYFIQQATVQEEAYKILLEGLEDFAVTQKDIEREREVILNEQNQFVANSTVYAWNLADRGLWPDSPLSDSALGTQTSISRITQADIVQYKELLFAPENIGFLTISSLELSAPLTKKLEALSPVIGDPIPHAQEAGVSRKIMCEHRAGDTLFLVVSIPLPGLAQILPDKMYLDYIRNYLASGWSSRLVERLRLDKNYTYWVFSGIESYREAGYFRISLVTTKQKLAEVVAIITEEIGALSQKKLSEEALTHHKNAMKAHLLKHYIQPEHMMWWYGWNIFLAGRIVTIGDFLEAIDTITAADVHACGKRYLQTARMHFAVLGSVSEADIEKAVHSST